MSAPIAYRYRLTPDGRFVYLAVNALTQEAGRGVVKFGDGAKWRERLASMRRGFRAARQVNRQFAARWYGEPDDWRFVTVMWINSEMAAQHVALLARARALRIDGTAPLGHDYAYDLSIAEGIAALRWATKRVRGLALKEGFALEVQAVKARELGDCLLKI